MTRPGAPIRSLVLGRAAPWALPRSGDPLRRTAVLRGLARAGPVTYLGVGEQSDPPLPPFVQRSLHVAAEFGPRPEPRAWLRHDRARTPNKFAGFTPLAPASIDVVVGEAAVHDLVWLGSADVAHLVLPFLDEAVVVDLFDLEGDRHRQTIARLRSEGIIRNASQILFEALQARAWRHWERGVTARATRVVVTKPDDVARLGSPASASVIPNGCDVPPYHGAHEPGRSSRVLFHGFLQYAPNREGCEWLVREVLPALRSACPDVEVRLVGDAPASVHQLGAIPNVTVVGYVDDIDAEVDAADLVVVPLLAGSGTRLKILEAFARQVPVVSTTIGCEGLGTVAGRDLLVADTPTDFAAACRVALTDVPRRRALVEQAYRVAQAHDWTAIEATIAGLAEQTLSPVRRPTG